MEDLRPGERDIGGTFEAVEDLEASLLPEARTGVPVEYLSSLVPVITSGSIEEDHLDLQVMLGERFPCSE